MKILGIDPGSRKTGYALIEVIGGKINLLVSGVLKYDLEKQYLARLVEVKNSMQKLIVELAPDEIALESLIYVKSPTSLFKLAQARGVLLSTFIESHCEKIFEYSPNLVKSSTTGHGHSDKLGVQKFFQRLFGVESFQTDDESDAVAIAFCHALMRKSPQVQIGKLGKTRGFSQSLIHKIKELE